MDSIELAIPQRRRSLGGGLEVGRILPFPRRRMVGPFIFFDHMGPSDFAPGLPRSMDVRPHPHIGLSTVTYLFDGEIMHRDSVGSAQAIRPGEVNWMVAGRGISHSERFERARAEGGALHGIQAWVALPREFEETTPSFAHHGQDDLPVFDDAGARVRLVAGSAFGRTAGVATHSPLFYLHAELDAGARLAIPAEYSERALYLVRGTLDVDGVRHAAGQMLVFARAATIVAHALEPCIFMVLGGEPVGERHIYWNFVSSSPDRIAEAAEDWRQGRMKLPDLDNEDFIPLPEDAPRPASR
jgi:redox-sensitive bicupin YhaK (pirin superfamily)